MIAGEPQVIERDGERIVVDENGDELVCRRDTTHSSGGKRLYHRIAAYAFETTGEIVPACDHITHQDGVRMLLRRRDDLATWDGCSYQWCYGSYDPYDPAQKACGKGGMAELLEEMSVEEFDVRLELHKRGDSPETGVSP